MSAVPDGVVRATSVALTPDSAWCAERCQGDEHRFGVERVLYDGDTAFQHVLIFESKEYGTMLVIDGETQSAEDDEHVYHEALVHPAMLAHPDPRQILIVGGGEGATLREVLRHRSVERAVMVDIDGELVDLARQYLHDWHRGSFDDPRVQLVIADGVEFLARTSDRFDVAFVDVCDYVEGTAAAPIYTPAFLASLASVLNEGGVAVIQGGELGRDEYQSHIALTRLIAGRFAAPTAYSTFIGSFWSEWSFLVVGEAARGIGGCSSAAVDAKIASRGLENLRFYDGLTHVRMFHLPKDIRDVLARVGEE